jgi:hypothetical protein
MAETYDRDPRAEVIELQAAGASSGGTMAVARVAGGTRWLLALLVAAVALGLAVVAAVVLSSRPDAEALRYVPAGSSVVVELRPDLPGDQRGRVGNLLAHFPGYLDQSLLDQKMDETLERLVRTASGGSIDYRTTVKPYVAGPAFAAFVGGPDATVDPTGDVAPVLVVLTTDGSVTCDGILGTAGQAYDHRGVTILPDRTGDGPANGCAMESPYLLLGATTAVERAIDARQDGTGVSSDAAYRAARAGLGGDRLASVYVAPRVLAAAMSSLTSGALGSVGSVASSLPPSALPEWAVATIRAADSSLALEGTMPIPDLAAIAEAAGVSAPPTPGPDRESSLAPIVPSDTVLVLEAHDVGRSLVALLDRLTAGTSGGDDGPLTMLGAVGGPENLAGWIRDAGIVVRYAGGAPSGGIVIVATDEAAASGHATQLANLLSLAGSAGSVSVQSEQDGATTITTVTIADPSALVPGLTVGGMPGRVADPVSFAFAARGATFVAGNDAAFVRAILDVAGANTLAGDPAYQRAIGLAGRSNVGQLYVNLAALAAAAPDMPGVDALAWATDVAPYVAPLEAAAGAATTSDGRFTGRLIVTVK